MTAHYYLHSSINCMLVNIQCFQAVEHAVPVRVGERGYCSL